MWHTLCADIILWLYIIHGDPSSPLVRGGGAFLPGIDKKGSGGKQVLKPLFRDLNSFFFSSLKRGFIGNDLRCFFFLSSLDSLFFFFLSLSTLTRQSELEYSFSHWDKPVPVGEFVYHVWGVAFRFSSCPVLLNHCTLLLLLSPPPYFGLGRSRWIALCLRMSLTIVFWCVCVCAGTRLSCLPFSSLYTWIGSAFQLIAALAIDFHTHTHTNLICNRVEW